VTVPGWPAHHSVVSECLTAWLRWLYEKTRLPLIPIYGGFPVKLMWVCFYCSHVNDCC